jgi:hypothetical protein
VRPLGRPAGTDRANRNVSSKETRRWMRRVAVPALLCRRVEKANEPQIDTDSRATSVARDCFPAANSRKAADTSVPTARFVA